MKRHLMLVLAMVAGMAIAADYDPAVHGNPIVVLTGSDTIDGHGAIIDAKKVNRCATLGPNVTLKNFIFRNGRAAVGGAVYGGAIESCEIESCTATEYGAAVANCKSVKGTTITGCMCSRNDSAKVAMHGGIAADSTLDGVTITGCRVALGTSAPGFGGIAANSKLTGCKVTGNTLVISGDHYGTIFYNCTVTGGEVTGNSGVNSSTVGAVMGGSVSDDCKRDDPEKPTPGPTPGPTPPPTPVEPGVPVFTGWFGDESGTVGAGFSAQIEAFVDGGSVKYKASGLPSGLKLNATTGEITGVPKSAKTYTVKITATNVKSSKLKAVFTQTVTIAALPAWAVGTFTGGGDEGILTKMTVSKTGKFSGTWLEAGQTWKVSAASYDFVDPGFGIAQANLLFKCGKVSEEVFAEITEDGIVSDVFVATRVDWKTEPWKSLGKSLSKKMSKQPLTIVDEDGNEFVVKISSSGSATVKATMADGYKATAKAALCQGDAEFLTATLFVYVAPKKNKFPEGYIAHFDLQFDADGNATVLP